MKTLKALVAVFVSICCAFGSELITDDTIIVEGA